MATAELVEENIVQGMIDKIIPTLKHADVDILGERFRVYGQESDGWFLMLRHSRSYDFEINLNDLRILIKPDATCIDVGAHIGVMALAFAKLAPQGKVLALEGCLPSAVACNYTCSPNPRIKVICAIVGLHDAPISWVQYDGQITSSHAMPGGNNRSIGLDEIDLDACDFIKIDVEGFELEVLEGAKNLLRKYEPIVLFEFNTFAICHFREQSPRKVLAKMRKIFPHLAVFPREKYPIMTALKPEDDEGFLSHSYFTGLVDNLVGSFTPIAPDLPGFSVTNLKNPSQATVYGANS